MKKNGRCYKAVYLTRNKGGKMFVTNIEDEIIYWLQNDTKAREYALYWSRPEFIDERSRHLLDMIETQFEGLHVPRNNESGSGEKGVYVCVIEDTWHILPETLTEDLFSDVLDKVAEEYKSRFSDSYTMMKPGENTRQINPEMRNDYTWKKWLLQVFQMYKHYYYDPEKGDPAPQISLIHYIDLSKKMAGRSAGTVSQATDITENALLTRW